MTGTSQIQSDNGLIACDVEIRILLPYHYLQIDTAPFGEKRAGFRGKTVLSAIKELGRTTSPPDRLKIRSCGVAFTSVAGGMHVPGARRPRKAPLRAAPAQRACKTTADA
jgi:hypothetical protein